MIEIFKTTEGSVLEKQQTVTKDCWISMTAPTAQEIKEISRACSLEEDVLRAALDDEERARIETEDDYTLIVIDIPAVEKEMVEKQEKDRYITMPLSIISIKDVIITVCLVDTPVLTHIKFGRMKGFSTHKKTRFILQIFYRVATQFLQNLRSINRQSESIEDKLHVSQKNKELFAFVRQLSALRKEHPLFTIERELRDTDFISCGWPEISVHGVTPWQVDYSSYNRLAAFLYCGDYVRKADRTFDDSFYVMFNMHWEVHEFELPQMEDRAWRVVFDTATGKNISEDKLSERCLTLEPRSMVVLQSITEKKKEIKKTEEKKAESKKAEPKKGKKAVKK